jgi:ribosome-associated protein
MEDDRVPLDERDEEGTYADDEVEGPSRTARKKASEALQDLGAALVDLRPDAFARLSLPDRLREAIEDARRITSFGAKRRQLQFIGKLMRRLAPEVVDEIREALAASEGRSARQTALLHQAERWRAALIADDAALERWLAEHPDTDAQQLRALIRQARKDARAAPPGEAPRQGRAFRQIFALVRERLVATRADEADTDDSDQ